MKFIAAEETDRHMMMWEYKSLSAFEQYKERRGGYEGPYAEYKKVNLSMSVEVWRTKQGTSG